MEEDFHSLVEKRKDREWTKMYGGFMPRIERRPQPLHRWHTLKKKCMFYLFRHPKRFTKPIISRLEYSLPAFTTKSYGKSQTKKREVMRKERWIYSFRLCPEVPSLPAYLTEQESLWWLKKHSTSNKCNPRFYITMPLLRETSMGPSWTKVRLGRLACGV